MKHEYDNDGCCACCDTMIFEGGEFLPFYRAVNGPQTTTVLCCNECCKSVRFLDMGVNEFINFTIGEYIKGVA